MKLDSKTGLTLVPTEFLNELMEGFKSLSYEFTILRQKMDDDELLTRIEAASYIKLHPKTFDKKNFLRTILADGSVRYKKSDLLAPKEVSITKQRTKRGMNRKAS